MVARLLFFVLLFVSPFGVNSDDVEASVEVQSQEPVQSEDSRFFEQLSTLSTKAEEQKIAIDGLVNDVSEALVYVKQGQQRDSEEIIAQKAQLKATNEATKKKLEDLEQQIVEVRSMLESLTTSASVNAAANKAATSNSRSTEGFMDKIAKAQERIMEKLSAMDQRANASSALVVALRNVYAQVRVQTVIYLQIVQEKAQEALSVVSEKSQVLLQRVQKEGPVVAEELLAQAKVFISSFYQLAQIKLNIYNDRLALLLEKQGVPPQYCGLGSMGIIGTLSVIAVIVVLNLILRLIFGLIRCCSCRRARPKKSKSKKKKH